MEREMRLLIYEKELRRLLLDLRDHDFAIFEDSRDHDRYVQFFVHDSALLGEVGSRHWMPESSGLRKTSATALGCLGFEGGGPRRNFRRDHLPHDARKLACLTELVVRKHIVPVIGSKTLSKLTANDVEHLLANRRKAGLAPRSVHHVRAVLRNALKKAQRDRLVAYNVASEADAPAVPTIEMKSLTPEHVKVFLRAVKGRPLEALYVTTLAVGLRQGEGLGLRWSDLDLNAGTLRVTRALQWIRPRGERRAVPALVEPKSRSSRRALTLPAVALEALHAHRKRWVDEKLRIGDRWLNEWDLVFTGPMGEPLNPKTVWKDYRDVLKSADLPLIRYHDLRHSCASLLLLHGVPARMVQEILGHSSITLTLGTNSHVLPGLREQATSAMDAVLGG